MGNSVRDKHVPFVRFALIYIESGTSLTIGVGLGTGTEKSKWNTIFRLDIPVGNFGVPLKTFRLFGKFSGRANQNSLSFTFQPKFPDFFGKW